MTITCPAQPHQDDDELPFGGEIALERALERVVQLFASCDRLEARGEELPGRLTAQVLGEFDRLVYAFDRTARYSLPDRIARIGAHVRAALLPLARRSENAWRWCQKPRGYAGDHLAIARMYEDEACGDGPVGALVDRCFLRLPAVRAVQHRRELLVREIRSVIAAGEGRPVHVTSLAAAPAREIFELYARLDEPRVLVSTLVDFDPAALASCAAEKARLGLEDRIELVRANLIHIAVGRHALELAPQDFIYSVGLIDSFDDALVVKLLDCIHAALRPGGRVLIGNFHPRNPTRAIMDHVLDWKLVHRDEDAMNALFRASAFGAACTRIVYEPQRIHLFAECVKA